MSEVICPICSTESTKTYSIESKWMHQKLAETFGYSQLHDLNIIDYQMQKCKRCELEFAHPLQAGSSEFYNWVTIQKNYYVNTRWEFSKLINLFKDTEKEDFSIVDVGCGSGLFLKNLILKMPKCNIQGIDITREAVLAAQKNNVPVFEGTMVDFVKNNIEEKFDKAVSFHCLEHIENPKEFISQMLTLIKDSGSVIVSTPYSPQSGEIEWFDPMNHPPHHIFRFNLNSYKELANQLNLEIEYHLPPAKSILKRTLLSTFFTKYKGSMKDYSLKIGIINAVKNLNTFIKHFSIQAKRHKINDIVAADVILVEFTKKD